MTGAIKKLSFPDGVTVDSPTDLGGVTVTTSWGEFTPSFNNATGLTFSTNSGRWRRVGDSMEIHVFAAMTSDGTDAADFEMIIPDGRTANVIGHDKVGDGSAVDEDTTDTLGDIHVNASVGTVLTFSGNTGAGAYADPLQGNDFGSSAGRLRTLQFTATVPISEWADSAVINEIIQDNLSEWESCTVTGNWTSGCTYAALCRQVGDHMQYQVYIDITGAIVPAATGLNIALPAGDEIDTSKILPPSGGLSSLRISPFGFGRSRDEGSATYLLEVGYSSTTAVSVACKAVSGTYATIGTLNDTTPFGYLPGDDIYVEFSVPLTRLSGSQDSLVGFNEASSTALGLTKFVGARGEGDTAQSISTTSFAYNTLTYASENYDTNDSYDLTTYTVPETGIYHIEASCEVTFSGGNPAAGFTMGLGVRLDGVTDIATLDQRYTPGTNSNFQFFGSIEREFTAGDEISIFFRKSGTDAADTSGDTRQNWFSIRKTGQL